MPTNPNEEALFDNDEEVELLLDYTSPTTGKKFSRRAKGVVLHSYYAPSKDTFIYDIRFHNGASESGIEECKLAPAVYSE
ncbi:hypothetical protein CVT26_015089 [Gymnopilus dilepis]|uniref:Uncharacterized protein n=1 Tax=Gymnopilus dilepis TaxID=231916 RepID=A0A409YEL6_9AGAR|nr:hypothetical protein CVT26_015089 [Gymnopilus dilepis]